MKSLGQRFGTDRAPRWPRRQPFQVHQRARAPWAHGLSGMGRRSARGLRGTGVGSYGCCVLRPQPPTLRGFGETEPRATVRGGACPALAAQKTMPSPPRRACSVVRGRMAGPPWGEPRADRSPQNLTASITAFQSPSCQSGAWSVTESLSARCGMERAPHWPRRQPRQVRQRARLGDDRE